MLRACLPSFFSDSLACLRVKFLQTQILCPFLPLLVVNVCRAFGHDDDVGSGDSFRKVAESSNRKEIILEYGPAVVDEDDGKVRFERPVLECVIKHYDVCLRNVLVDAPACLL